MPHILVVDDNPDMHAALRAALSHAGVEVADALSGKQALQQARSRWPDAVVLDLELHGALSGWDTWRELRTLAAGRRLKVVVVSGDLAGLLRARDEGADDAVSKRKPPADIVLRILRVLNPTEAR